MTDLAWVNPDDALGPTRYVTHVNWRGTIDVQIQRDNGRLRSLLGTYPNLDAAHDAIEEHIAERKAVSTLVRIIQEHRGDGE